MVPIKSTWSFNLLSAELRALNINVQMIIERKLAATGTADAVNCVVVEESNGTDDEDEEGDEMYDHALDNPEAMAKELELQLRLMEDAADIAGKV